jgi:hypothetical protein
MEHRSAWMARQCECELASTERAKENERHHCANIRFTNPTTAPSPLDRGPSRAGLRRFLIKVERCRIIPGAFSKGFSTGFDTQRKVCDQVTLGYLVATKIEYTVFHSLAG